MLSRSRTVIGILRPTFTSTIRNSPQPRLRIPLTATAAPTLRLAPIVVIRGYVTGRGGGPGRPFPPGGTRRMDLGGGGGRYYGPFRECIASL